MDWEANSPDMWDNTIGHVLDYLNRLMKSQGVDPKNYHELQTAVLEDWQNIPFGIWCLNVGSRLVYTGYSSHQSHLAIDLRIMSCNSLFLNLLRRHRQYLFFEIPGISCLNKSSVWYEKILWNNCSRYDSSTALHSFCRAFVKSG